MELWKGFVYKSGLSNFKITLLEQLYQNCKQQKYEIGITWAAEGIQGGMFLVGENESIGLGASATVDASGVKTWAGLRRKITQFYGEGSVFAKGWPKNPLAVLNEELLNFNGGILERLENS